MSEAAQPLRIVVGVTGGIAAYKAVGIVRSLVLAGHEVQVIATENALRFVGKPTLEAISRHEVHTDLYEGVAEVRHVALGQTADLILIAPATANSIARLAAGLADDLLSNTVLASRAPIVVAPAMHSEMWSNTATTANVALLRQRGMYLIGPASGALTGTDSGVGRMAEPDDVVAFALETARRGRQESGATADLAGLSVLITAGGTREPLDPVRYLGNRSSGKQGVALALAASTRGADVTLVAAHLEIEPPQGIRTIFAGTAHELDQLVRREQESADVIIMAAAVADYRPAEISATKIKKDDVDESLTLELVKNPDILRGLAKNARPGQLVVGFAAETADDPEALLALGRAKIARKGCDFLVLNRVGWSTGFGTDGNAVGVLNRAGDIVIEVRGSKLSVANGILDALAQHTRTRPLPLPQSPGAP